MTGMGYKLTFIRVNDREKYCLGHLRKIHSFGVWWHRLAGKQRQEDWRIQSIKSLLVA